MNERRGRSAAATRPGDGYIPVVWFPFLVVVFALWYNYSEKIVAGIFAIRRAEGYFLLKILSVVDGVSHLVDADMMATANLKSALAYMEATPPSQVSYKDLFRVSSVFGEAFTLPSIIIGGLGIVYSLFFHRFSKFKQVYTMSSLSRQEVVNWPQISCVMGKNLIKEDIDQGEWRMSLQPLNFSKQNGLLRTETVKGVTVARLDKDKARSVFSSQMGPLWTGLEVFLHMF